MIRDGGNVIDIVSITMTPMMDDIHIKDTLLRGHGIDKIICLREHIEIQMTGRDIIKGNLESIYISFISRLWYFFLNQLTKYLLYARIFHGRSICCEVRIENCCFGAYYSRESRI